jgi:hypothetical protein
VPIDPFTASTFSVMQAAMRLHRLSVDHSAHTSIVWRRPTKGARCAKLKTATIDGVRFTSTATLCCFFADLSNHLASARTGDQHASSPLPAPGLARMCIPRRAHRTATRRQGAVIMRPRPGTES